MQTKTAFLLVLLAALASEPALAQFRPTVLRPIVATHTLPPYPEDSVTAQEQGTTVLEVHLTDTGMVDACKVYQSSGFDRLDQAACAHVHAVWRWQPPLQDNQPVAISTLVKIVWDLKQAQ